MTVQIQIRRDTTANWQTSNPVLDLGEPGYDTTAHIMKVGDGVTPWTELEAFVPADQLADVATSGSYNDLSDKPTIPVVTPQVQSSWIQTNPAAASFIANKPTLATVATSGSYNDLSDKPTIPDLTTLATVATTGTYSDLIGKPTLFSGNYNDLANKPTILNIAQFATVATTGSYNSLLNKPILFSGSYTDLTNKPSIPITLAALTGDVILSTPSAGEVLKYDGNRWVNGSVTSANTSLTVYWNDVLNKPLFATTGSYNDLTNKPTLSTVAGTGSYTDLLNKPALFSGSYADLTNKPTIPSALTGLSDVVLSNVTSGQVLKYDGTKWVNGTDSGTSGPGTITWNDVLDKPTFAAVATSGSYNSLAGTPTLASVATSGLLTTLTDVNVSSPTTGQILRYDGTQWANATPTSATTIPWGNVTGKPTFATVATSGSYNDLSGTPTLAAVATTGSYSSLTGTPSIPTTLAALTGDVLINTPASNQLLKYNGTKWVNDNKGITLNGIPLEPIYWDVVFNNNSGSLDYDNGAGNILIVGYDSAGNMTGVVQPWDSGLYPWDYNQSATITWSAVTNAAYYRVYWSYPNPSVYWQTTNTTFELIGDSVGSTVGNAPTVQVNNSGITVYGPSKHYNNITSYRDVKAVASAIDTQPKLVIDNSYNYAASLGSGFEIYTNYFIASVPTDSIIPYLRGNYTSYDGYQYDTGIRVPSLRMSNTWLLAGSSNNTTFTLPPTMGSATQVLKTDGAGVTGWANVANGTPGYMPRFNTTESVADSNVYEDVSKVGVNRTLLARNITTGGVNLITYSQDFTTAAWAKASCTISPNATTAPDGTTTAGKLVESNTSGAHTISHSGGNAIPIEGGKTYTLSGYFKSAGRSMVQFQYLDSTGGTALFNIYPRLDTEYAEWPDGISNNSNSTILSSSVTAVGNGWVRAQYTFVAAATATAAGIFVAPLKLENGSYTYNYLGDGTSGIYVWGLQLEQNQFASPYSVTPGTYGRIGANVGAPTATLHLAAGTATAQTAPLKFTSGINLTTAEAGTVEYDGTAMYATGTTASGRGLILAPMIARVNADRNKATNDTSLQAVFNGANDTFALQANTLYHFRGTYYLTKSDTGSTSAQLQIGFIFSNTPVDIRYDLTYQDYSTQLASIYLVTTAAATAAQNGSNTGSVSNRIVKFEGWFKTNATTGGTVIPAFAQTAVGSSVAPTAQAGSFIMIQPITSAPSTNLIAGNWS